MTVESTSRKQTFAGAQASLTFSFRTLVNHPEYIKVKNIVVSTGLETDLTYGVDYTVSLLADGSGGTVILSPTYSSTYNHTVYRVTEDKQESDYNDFNQFPADTIENDIDRRTLISQERAEDTTRALKLPITSSVTDLQLPTPEAGKALIWNAAEDGFDNAQVTIIYISATQLILKVIEDSDSLNTGDGQLYVTLPSIFNGLNLTEVGAHVYTAPTSGTVTMQIRNVTDAVDMLSTKITIDPNETDSSTAAIPAVIDGAHDDVATADVLAIDVDVAGSGTKGLEIRLRFS